MMKRYHKRTAEEMKAEIDQTTERLVGEVKSYLQSGRFNELLDAMSKFHHYSLRNSLLIYMQKPDATKVASYTSWKRDFNRAVKRGEKGLKILAPMPRKVKQEKEKLDPVTNMPVIGSDGKPETEVTEVQINRGFKIAYTFDISQTEPLQNGRPVPDLDIVHELKGNVADYQNLMNALSSVSPVPISFENISGGAKGYYSPTESRIVIKTGMSEQATVKTCLHEICHSMIHNHEAMRKREEEGKQPYSREDMEVTAESVAYVTAHHYGLDTSDYSIGYVGSWASENNDVLEENLQIIKNTSGDMIEKIDEVLEKEREEAAEKEDTFSKAASEITTKIDAFARDFDPYEYADSDGDSYRSYNNLLESVRLGNLGAMQDQLKEIAGDQSEEMYADAAKLNADISEYLHEYEKSIGHEKKAVFERDARILATEITAFENQYDSERQEAYKGASFDKFYSMVRHGKADVIQKEIRSIASDSGSAEAKELADKLSDKVTRYVADHENEIDQQEDRSRNYEYGRK